MPLISIVFPSSPERNVPPLIESRINYLKSKGFEVVYQEVSPDPGWMYASASVSERSRVLNDALLDPAVDIVWCARGGYGASDLLPMIPWARLKQVKKKLVVGFSDASALISACFSKLGWVGIHGPMPASTLWGEDGHYEDIEQILHLCEGSTREGEISLSSESEASSPISGFLFGGCLSVITNLIGTEYFPKNMNNTILFWEDISENPGRVMRHFNQWDQASLLQGVRAIILGKFIMNQGEVEVNISSILGKELKCRTKIPIFMSEEFGHCCPNYPVPVGALGSINANRLKWKKGE